MQRAELRAQLLEFDSSWTSGEKDDFVGARAQANLGLLLLFSVFVLTFVINVEIF